MIKCHFLVVCFLDRPVSLADRVHLRYLFGTSDSGFCFGDVSHLVMQVLAHVQRVSQKILGRIVVALCIFPICR